MTLPEGRAPIGSQDMAKMHPSTWEAEAKALRRDYSLIQIDRNNLRNLLDGTEAKVDELHDKLEDAEAEAKALRAAITDALASLDASPFTGAEHQQAKDILRKALK